MVPELQQGVGAQQSGGAQAALLCSAPCAASVRSFYPCDTAQLPAEDPAWSINFSSRDL